MKRGLPLTPMTRHEQRIRIIDTTFFIGANKTKYNCVGNFLESFKADDNSQLLEQKIKNNRKKKNTFDPSDVCLALSMPQLASRSVPEKTSRISDN